MTEEEKEQPASEVAQQEEAPHAQNQADEPKTVPLEALQAERRKRQDVEQNYKNYQELVKRLDQQKEAPPKASEEDEEELVSRKDLKDFQQNLTTEQFFALKREIAEESFKETQPKAIKAINENLKQILEQKPWLADSIDKATNRYARAYEIVQDYNSLLAGQQTKKSDANRVVENAQKPGSPAATAKSSQLSGPDYLKSIAGTSEFREYRKKLLGR